ncbi:MAG: ACT domain-containing protein [Syntrophomonadaceae bacterium]
MNSPECQVIKLTVRNHPGVMYHITGLFSRRSFNLEGILCSRVGDGTNSQIYLLVRSDAYLEQVVKQLNKLHDVLEVSLMENCDQTVFTMIPELVKMQ